MPTFETPDPVTLDVDLPAGRVVAHADATDTTTIELRPMRAGDRDAEALIAESRVEHQSGRVVVHVPHSHSGLLRRTPQILAEVRAPVNSQLVVRTQSADVVATGELGDTKINTGSGDIKLDDVDGSLVVESGSGDVRVGSIAGTTTIKTASGDVTIDRCCDIAKITAASGDVRIRTAEGELDLRTASGDATVDEAEGSVGVRTASGDVDLHRVQGPTVGVTSASGDVEVGVEAGRAVWLDVSSLSGTVRSNLESTDEQASDQPTLQLRIATTSGDVSIHRA